LPQLELESKPAVQDLSVFTVMEKSGEDPEQSPLQLVNTEPAAGVAVRTTAGWVPSG
jgi:hypothetical protein